ncbi:galactose-1-phosphate uridylyltransferase [Rhodococcus sp. BP-252]|uniref:galactose-1-phosphate uridylyltransferase n=1 Tax=unclassified Rhodococcus (in: high G+C Gram-positive bacteria) TaxID=192944 RepID=UPI001C9BA91A|nr:MULTISPECIES: galactose-1-phosphate uridylyltransferase [unclassified Rhodococcus (in: high G+C Gram-positive bacteria)]MBY6414342.1 galactose-1-phosphate uridylyltransferase [Rhodococcus sp. BP-320]MBY6419112.1 galactose-1-phosphate uridylyltransferase [Rhodococcus sp. BP-321]MBY6423797.1 galactose-1-phosphate uridylyltransferase [Rhodococcus sp. BP-324]MBY6429181.1 galactose-1-phosphate uridylyltransferase [Rhodococcus sp. BP-323]MBY6434152.1 galactose-1-phosphate uridylyltransferase [Rho
MKITQAALADGREILFFSLPGNDVRPVPDVRPLSPRPTVAQSEVRRDRQTGDWIAIAALRQDRTYKPPADQCPLCPSPRGDSSEVPAADYDVVVFENRFPSLSHGGPAAEPLDPESDSGPGVGRCEVICFSSNHTTSFFELSHQHARLVVDVWRQRTETLLAMPGIEQVFCFENRGEEIGVTLSHPHGQIYGYPYLTPRTTSMLRQARTFAENNDGANLFEDILAREIQDGVRVIASNGQFTAFVPFAARWPVEVHIYPNRHVHNLTDLTEPELDGLTDVYLDVLGRFDRMYPTLLPYISALHQYRPDRGQQDGYFHIELMSVRRSATKLKFLAGSESAMDAFITDVTPEQMADRLKELRK